MSVARGKGNYRKVIPGKVLTPTGIDRNGAPGYLTVKAAGQTLLVHRLVALAWLHATWFDGAEVNHKDGRKQNNAVHNLEWVTHSQNELHSYRVLGKNHNKRKVLS